MIKSKLKNLFSIVLISVSLSGTSCTYNAYDGFSTTFAPMYDFTKRIVGNTREVITIVGNNEPHVFSPTKSQLAAKVETSRLLVAYGHEMDDFAKKMISEDKYFVATNNIDFEKTSDGRNIDPHAWLSISNASSMLANIADKLIEVDPANKETYEANLDVALEEFTDLNNKFKVALDKSKIKTNVIVTSHEAFGYFANDYGLIQYGIADIANNEPAPSRIRETASYIMENDVHTIFVEELDSSGYVSTIIEEIKSQSPDYVVNIAELNAYETVNEDEWSTSDNYLSVMESNLKSIAKALGNEDYQ